MFCSQEAPVVGAQFLGPTLSLQRPLHPSPPALQTSHTPDCNLSVARADQRTFLSVIFYSSQPSPWKKSGVTFREQPRAGQRGTWVLRWDTGQEEAAQVARENGNGAGTAETPRRQQEVGGIDSKKRKLTAFHSHLQLFYYVLLIWNSMPTDQGHQGVVYESAGQLTFTHWSFPLPLQTQYTQNFISQIIPLLRGKKIQYLKNKQTKTTTTKKNPNPPKPINQNQPNNPPSLQNPYAPFSSASTG